MFAPCISNATTTSVAYRYTQPGFAHRSSQFEPGREKEMKDLVVVMPLGAMRYGGMVDGAGLGNQAIQWAKGFALAEALKADIGLVHYPPRSVDSRGQRFAAPGKAFDYLAAALPIVATSNPSMRTLLADDQFGITATEDTEAAYASAVAVAIRRFSDGLTDRHHIAESFAAHWSADQCVPHAVTWIESVCGHRRSSVQRRRESPADANCTLDDSHLKR